MPNVFEEADCDFIVVLLYLTYTPEYTTLAFIFFACFDAVKIAVC